MKAEVRNNNLLITSKTSEATTKFEFKLEGSILSCNFSSGEALTGLMTTSMLIDSIGQIHGYKDGELFDTLNSEQIKNYTVENEGLEVKEAEDGKYDVKIDINKRLPLADFSNVYIEAKDMDNFLLDILHSDEPGYFYASKGEISYKVEKYDSFIVYIAEKNELTERTYKSILSFIEAAFENENVVDYFKNNYVNIAEGNKAFDGFEVILNPSDVDLPEFKENYKTLELVIDKEKVEEIIESKKTSELKGITWSNASEWAISELNKAKENILQMIMKCMIGAEMQFILWLFKK